MIYFPSLIHPLSIKDFFSIYWRKKELHITQRKVEIESLFSYKKLSDFLNTHAYNLSYPEVRLTIDGEPVNVKEYLEEMDFFINLNSEVKKNKISPLKVNRFLSEGASLILSDISEYDKDLQKFIKNLSMDINERLNLVLFLSFPSKKSFLPHKDIPDIFSFQIDGDKKWIFYDKNPNVIDDKGTHLIDDTVETKEVILKKGEILYIPTGRWHTAMALDKKPSLSLNLIVSCKQKIDLATRIIEDHLYPKLIEDNYFKELLPLKYNNIKEDVYANTEISLLIDVFKDKFKYYVDMISVDSIKEIVQSFSKNEKQFTSTIDYPFDIESICK